MVRSRLLAGETDERIAARLGTMPETIHWFCHVFFDVRDRLRASDWIAKTILGTWAARISTERGGAMTAPQRDLAMMSFAYFGGSHALDAVILGFRRGQPLVRAADGEQWFEQTLKYMTKVQATIAMRNLEVNKFNVMQLLEIGFRLMETEKSAGNDEKRKNALEEAFANLLGDIPWGLELERQKQHTPLEKFMSGPVEPRAQEQLLLASGETPEGLTEYQQHWRQHVVEGTLKITSQE